MDSVNLNVQDPIYLFRTGQVHRQFIQKSVCYLLGQRLVLLGSTYRSHLAAHVSNNFEDKHATYLVTRPRKLVERERRAQKRMHRSARVDIILAKFWHTPDAKKAAPVRGRGAPP
jgi:hypothetical protein